MSWGQRILAMGPVPMLACVAVPAGLVIGMVIRSDETGRAEYSRKQEAEIERQVAIALQRVVDGPATERRRFALERQRRDIEKELASVRNKRREGD